MYNRLRKYKIKVSHLKVYYCRRKHQPQSIFLPSPLFRSLLTASSSEFKKKTSLLSRKKSFCISSYMRCRSETADFRKKRRIFYRFRSILEKGKFPLSFFVRSSYLWAIKSKRQKRVSIYVFFPCIWCNGIVVWLSTTFCFILLTHKGSHREVYWEFQPSYDIFRRWCQGLFRPQIPCNPNLHCPIANSASTQSQQPV